MNCLRCGREIPADQAFCPECLGEMDKYPVKPGTAIQLPKREEDPFTRRPARRVNITPEMQLARMKRRFRLISVILALLIFLAAGLGILGGAVLERRRAASHMGQNYSTSAEEDDNVSRETSNDRR